MSSQRMEQYCFFRLYSIDLDEAKHTLSVLKKCDCKDVRYCLLRDIVVSYCRPFSGNKGDKILNHVLTKKVVPKNFCALHDEIISIRNQLFAHTDYTYRRPRVVNWSTNLNKWFPMSFRGYDYNKLDLRVSEIERLVEAVEKNLQAKIDKIEEILQGTLGDGIKGNKRLFFT